MLAVTSCRAVFGRLGGWGLMHLDIDRYGIVIGFAMYNKSLNSNILPQTRPCVLSSSHLLLVHTSDTTISSCFHRPISAFSRHLNN